MDLDKLADTLLETMDISVRGHEALQRNNVRTLRDLAKHGVLEKLGSSSEIRAVHQGVTEYLLRLVRESEAG